jgi:hypothetical protein
MHVPSTLSIAPILILCVGFSVSSACHAEMPTSPHDWVAFSADITVKTASGETISNGKYWRTKDGSDRLETNAAARSPVVQIRNVSASLCYRFREGFWTAQPMVLPSNGWRPPFKTIKPGSNRVMVGGFVGYRISSDRGDYVIRVPELNFFDVLTFTAKDRRYEEYFSVTLGEPDPNLFLPPTNVFVKQLTQPGGIIASK